MTPKIETPLDTFMAAFPGNVPDSFIIHNGPSGTFLVGCIVTFVLQSKDNPDNYYFAVVRCEQFMNQSVVSGRILLLATMAGPRAKVAYQIFGFNAHFVATEYSPSRRTGQGYTLIENGGRR